MKRFALQILASVTLLLTLLISQNSSAQSKVVLAGTFQDELGCPGDWQPWCDATALTYDAATKLWSGTFTLDTGYWQYKVAYDGSWNESYGENGGPDNIKLYVPVKSNITFVYNPATHLVTSYAPVKDVQLFGEFQDELGCLNDWLLDCSNSRLVYNQESDRWEGTFALPAGCYKYLVKVTSELGDVRLYGENGSGPDQNLQLYLPQTADVTFSYDATTHLVTTSPYGSPGLGVRKVSLYGTLQDEIGCPSDWAYFCDNAGLTYNATSGKWEGTFSLPAGCYNYQVKEEFGCNVSNVFYGEGGVQNGPYIQLSVPAAAAVSFAYDPQTHLVTSTPYSGMAIENVTLVGTFQTELGCAYDWAPDCTNSSLAYNAATGKWEGTFTLPAGCYNYQVNESSACGISNRYGEGGVLWGSDMILYVPADGEIHVAYDPQTHLVSPTPNSVPQLNSVTLIGTLQSELGCANDWASDCSASRLVYNAASGKWEATFSLPAGCYSYLVVENTSCGTNYYGQDGTPSGNALRLYLTDPAEVTFTYDATTHMMLTPPAGTPPQTVTKVSLFGNIQDVSGCGYDHYNCDKPALSFNAATGRWEGSFTLPAGCYSYQVKETVGCDNVTFYGENGQVWGSEYQLYIPSEAEITFVYDPQGHTLSSTPYSGAPQELLKVSLFGTLQSELGCAGDYDSYCGQPALSYDAATGKWTGKYTLAAGCYSYWVHETVGCGTVTAYGENGEPGGNAIQLYLPESAEVTFVYDAQTHTISTAPYGPPPSVVTKVSLRGDLQSETGCSYDFDDACDNPALAYNESTGKWEGTFTLPPGCYSYHVKQTMGCNTVTYYGEGGQVWGNLIQLNIPVEAEVTFVYDPETHTITTTPYSGIPVSGAALVGDFQTQLGCSFNWDYWSCDKAALTYHESSGLWEGTFTLEAGCYKYVLRQSKACGFEDIYGQDGSNYGNEFYNYYELYVPAKTDVTFTYNPQTHLVSSAYNGVCPPSTVVLPGNFQSELGCKQVQYGLPDGDWEPACDATRLTFDAATGLFVGTFTIPAGNWEFKVAYNNSWAENYGLDGLRDGPNIPLELCAASQVTFTYNYKTHLVALAFHPTAICISKFYDANLNGINDEGMPLEGVQFTLAGQSSAVQYTNSEGQTAFTGLAEGNYSVSETLQPGWVATGPLTRSLALTNPTTLNFGNVCLGAGGGHPVSFWTNKHGAEVLNDNGSVAPELALLSSLHLRDVEGNDFNPTSYEQLVKWLKGANAKNMAYKLSAELAALQLSVEAGFVDDSSMVYANIGDPMGRENFTDVKGLMAKVDAYLQADGYTPGGDGNRAVQEFLRNVLEQANHNMSFVQPAPCNGTTVMAKQGKPVEADGAEFSGATVSPNPSDHDFSLRVAAGNTGEVLSIRVMDVQGRVVYTATGSAQKEYRFGEAWKAGLYFVEITQGAHRSTLKVVKQ